MFTGFGRWPSNPTTSPNLTSGLPSDTHTRHSSVSSHHRLRKLPDFQDVPLNHRQQLFVDKIAQCNVIFNFNDASCDLHSKEIKLFALNDLQGYVKNEILITEPMWQIVAEMFAKNVFRPMPSYRHNYHELLELEDDDEPILDDAWMHIQEVYELFLLTIQSKFLTKGLAKSYVDQSFVLHLLERFGSEDPRERDFLKATLHCLYRKFRNLRTFIRKSISNIFLQFSYESGTFFGIAELLEILTSIISGLALPLKDEYKRMLTQVLLPLHKPSALGKYHLQLSHCIAQYLEKDPSLSPVVVLTLLQYWPRVDSIKECLFLDEMEHVLELTEPEDFVQIQDKLFRRLAKSIASPHRQVAGRALFFWNNERFRSLVKHNIQTILPIMFASMYESSEYHWNSAVQSAIYDVMVFFIRTSPQLFDDCLYKHADQKQIAAADDATRERRWEALRDKANLTK